MNTIDLANSAKSIGAMVTREGDELHVDVTHVATSARVTWRYDVIENGAEYLGQITEGSLLATTRRVYRFTAS